MPFHPPAQPHMQCLLSGGPMKFRVHLFFDGLPEIHALNFIHTQPAYLFLWHSSYFHLSPPRPFSYPHPPFQDSMHVYRRPIARMGSLPAARVYTFYKVIFEEV